MHIHFGTHFGFENVYPPILDREREAIHGEIYLGRKGLLEWLELHLGLITPDYPGVIRLKQYKKAVTKALADNPSLYYADSFEVDDVGTSLQLLTWRDELVLGKWDFKCGQQELSRLYALAKIETYVSGLQPGVNDRWISVRETLRQRMRIPLDHITIYEPKQTIHPFYSELFTRLEEMGVEITWHQFDFPIRGKTDLEKFKQAILDGNIDKLIVASGDKSILILEAPNEQLIAHALASAFKPEELEHTVCLLEDRRGEVLEHALINRGHPAMGYSHLDTDTGIDQLFRLISFFLWDPLDAEKLVRYLGLHLAPIEMQLRRKLAKTFADVQGIGSEQWDNTIEEYLVGKPGKKQARIKANIDRYFHRPKFDPEEGAPSNRIGELYSELKSWAENLIRINKEMDQDTRESLGNLIQRCQALIDVVSDEEGPSLLSEIQLGKWITQAERESRGRTGRREVGSMLYVPHPANFVHSPERVIWWNFVDQGNPLGSFTRWTKEEMKLLPGESLPAASQIIDHWHWSIQHAFRMAETQIILCLPKKVLGEEVEAHPFLSDIRATFGNDHVLSLTLNTQETTFNLGTRDAGLRAIPAKDLPRRHAYWQIGRQPDLKEREYESYSSLEKLYYYPYQYFLKYLLKIEPTRIPDVAINPLLKGNLAHRIAENLLAEIDKIDPDSEGFKARFDNVFDRIIRNEGIIFLQPRNKIVRDQFRSVVFKAMTSLVKSIKENGWKVTGREKLQKIQSGQIPLQGYIDLILERKDEIAIVDLKWGGLTRRNEELIREKELQLIIYYKLLNTTSPNIHLAYFIINRQQMLARNKKAFRHAAAIPDDKDETLVRSDIWNKMLHTYEARWEELREGQVEVGDDIDIQEFNSAIWRDEEWFLSMPRTRSKKEVSFYNEYLSFTGWD